MQESGIAGAPEPVSMHCIFSTWIWYCKEQQPDLVKNIEWPKEKILVSEETLPSAIKT